MFTLLQGHMSFLSSFFCEIIVVENSSCLSRSKIVIQIYPNWELLWPFSSPVRSDKCYICTKKTLKKNWCEVCRQALHVSLIPFDLLHCCLSSSPPTLALAVVFGFDYKKFWTVMSGQVVLFRTLMWVKAYWCRKKYNWRLELNSQSFL